MWLVIDKQSFAVTNSGFGVRNNDADAIYTSFSIPAITTIKDMANVEYGQAVIVNSEQREVSFARDYLGHYPLLYASTVDALMISDDLESIRQWLLLNEHPPSISTEAVALYFTMGYIPQGMSLYNEIIACENASVYIWDGKYVIHERIFKPIEIEPNLDASIVGDSIEQEIQNIVDRGIPIDIWCSGGLDSSIIASCFADREIDNRLLTFRYEKHIDQLFPNSELRFAQEVAEYYQTPLQSFELSRSVYLDAYRNFIGSHNSPIVDTVVPPKYALAAQTRGLAITGEGGDPIFSGVKNNAVLYLQKYASKISFGEIYAYAHKRLYEFLPEIFIQGQDLKAHVVNYLDKLCERYPGDANRKLFYLNTFDKQGGMIFPKNYAAAKQFNINIRHPLTALSVYQSAFRLKDDLKYQYPNGKLLLTDLFKHKLPRNIINRNKSGTRIPLVVYSQYIMQDFKGFNGLKQLGIFSEQYLENILQVKLEAMSGKQLLLMYSLLTLNYWIENKGVYTNVSNLPVKHCS